MGTSHSFLLDVIGLIFKIELKNLILSFLEEISSLHSLLFRCNKDPF